MNHIQTAFLKIQDILQSAEEWQRAEERQYIRRHEIKNQDGTVPDQLEDLDDPERADNFLGDFWDCVMPKVLIDELAWARKEMTAVEEALIAWGLTHLTPSDAETLRDGIKTNAARRRNALRLFMKLPDDSTQGSNA